MKRVVFAVLVLVLVLGSSVFGEELPFKSAPLNPEFIKYLERVKSGERNYGLMPLPLDLGKHKKEDFKSKIALPYRYDLRDHALVTSVKDQGSYGTCWAFATYGSLESHLLVRGKGTYDFSERNLVNRCGYDDPWNSGGNIFMSMAYLSRRSGPVYETEDPYSLGPGSSPILNGVIYVENALVLPGRENVYDNDYIKEIIYQYGAVYTSMFYDSSFYNDYYKSYYCGYSGYEPNHAVVLVGWDDNYFVPGAPGRGAWIVKNSWGTSWGERGYFYVSYYDLYIANHIAYFKDKDDINAGDFDVLYHDYCGMWDGLPGSDRIYGANVFQASYESRLRGVVISVYDLNGGYVDYTVRVYVGYSTPPNVSSVTPDAVKSGRLYYTGYYTIELDSSPYLDVGEPFVVVVELRPQYPSGAYPLGLEKRISGVSSMVTINPGESFVSSDGVSWTDLYNYYSSYGWGNLSIKAIISSYSSSSGGAGGGCSTSYGSMGMLLVLAPFTFLLVRRK